MRIYIQSETKRVSVSHGNKNKLVENIGRLCFMWL